MDSSLVVSFREGVSVESNGQGVPVLHAPGVRVVLSKMPDAVRGVLDRLAPPGESIERLSDEVHRRGAAGDVASLSSYLRRLAGGGFVVVSAVAAGQRWATLAPTGPVFTFAGKQLGSGAYALSRFAYSRRFGDVTVLESPLTAAQIILHRPAVGQLLCALATPTTAAELEACAPGLPAGAAEQVLRLLLAGGMLTEPAEHGTTVEDEQAPLVPWEFHDLLFHAASREGRHRATAGRTYPGADYREPPPIVKPCDFEHPIDLHRPELATLETTDPPLARVMEQRRSIRQYAAEPMTVEQLGEFLYRVARIRDVFSIEVETSWGNLEMEASSRPYPTSGGLFPLEFYPVVRACRGLEAGLYHYDPMHHRLGRVCGRTGDVDWLFDDAASAIREPRETLQVLLVLTARFDRLMWKYKGFAYSLILKDVGVVFQNMYLAATAMNLAPCAIGGGDSDRFARALGTDYYVETSVGEFTLGSMR